MAAALVCGAVLAGGGSTTYSNPLTSDLSGEPLNIDGKMNGDFDAAGFSIKNTDGTFTSTGTLKNIGTLDITGPYNNVILKDFSGNVTAESVIFRFSFLHGSGKLF